MSALAAGALAVASSLLWGTSDFLGGVLSRRRPAVAVVAGSKTAGLLLVLGVVAGTAATSGPGSGPLSVPAPGWLWWGVAASVTGTGGLVAFYAALSRAPMGVVAPVAALGAVVPLALGVAGGDRPGALQLAGVAVALAGAVGASGPELTVRAARSRTAVALAVASAVGLGFGLYAIERGSAASPVMTLLTMHACSVTVLLALAAVLGTTGGLRLRDAPGLAVVGGLDAAANLTVGVASTTGLISVTAVLGSLYPVVTVLLARTVLGERLGRAQAAGVAAALAGVALIATG